MIRQIIFFLTINLLFLASAQDRINVVSTIAMVGSIAEEVGGECSDVSFIMGPGIDPHLYQASARDVQSFNKADIILYSGYDLEGQLANVLERFARRKPTVAVSEASVAEEDLVETDDEYGVDPHIWMDASLWSQTVRTIATELSAVAPECETSFMANAERLESEILALHDWIKESIASIPEEQRVMVTAHDAFAYYGRAYDLEVVGIQGISTESEAGIGDIRDTAKLVAERQIPAVFVESTINPRTIQAVVEAAEQSGHSVVIGEELFSDAMGEVGTYTGTYIGMLYSNTKNITEGLGGELSDLPEALETWANRWNIDGSED